MSRSLFLAGCILVVLAFGHSEVPNFVLFVADDLGYGDLSCYGAPVGETPNIDKLAWEGVKFQQFYSASPICTPSRAAIMTGRLPVRTGMVTTMPYPLSLIYQVTWPWSPNGLPPSEITMAKALKTINPRYKTAFIGKWHLGHTTSHPMHHGFDEYYGVPYSQDEGCFAYNGTLADCPSLTRQLLPPLPLYDGEEIVEQPVEMSTLTDRYTSRAIEFIEQSASEGRPFLLVIAYNEVHVPLTAPPRFVNTSRRGAFGDALATMDDSVGSVMAAIERLGLKNNTLAVFTSDNGPWLDQAEKGGLAAAFREGKGTTWEGGLRIPAIFSWPGRIPAGRTIQEVGSLMDLMPTFVDIVLSASSEADRNRTRHALPRILDGVSLTPLLFPDNGRGSSEKAPNLPSSLHRISVSSNSKSRSNARAAPKDRFLAFYQNTILTAARYGPYKAHFFTAHPSENYMLIHQRQPLLYHVEHDPGEHRPIRPDSTEYKMALQAINKQVSIHKSTLKTGSQKPQLNEEFTDSVLPCASWCLRSSKYCACPLDSDPSIPLFTANATA